MERSSCACASASAGELVTVVVNGGKLGEHKGINAPGVKLPAAAVTKKDEEDLRFGLALGVDLVALSFVQTPEDCHAARRIMREAHVDVPLIAKIERPAGAGAPRRDSRRRGRRDGRARRPRVSNVRSNRSPASRRRSSRAPALWDGPSSSPRRSSNRCAPSRGRPARKSATRRRRWTREPTPSCWRVKRPPGSSRWKRSQTLSAVISDAETVAARRRSSPRASRSSDRMDRSRCRTASTRSGSSTAARCARPPSPSRRPGRPRRSSP